MNITELLKDSTYVSGLLNGPCFPDNGELGFAPINPDWIDEEASGQVTEAFHRLLPDGIPYLTRIVVEQNPDTMYNGTCVDDNEKRLRYFVLTVIPDTDYPYDYSFPLIHQMWTVSLLCWEIVRATLAAAVCDLRVKIATNPVPPILNNARIEWVSFYLGREPYRGISKLSEQWVEAKEFDGIETDVHLYKVREMEARPDLQRLIDAYDADYPIEKNTLKEDCRNEETCKHTAGLED